MRIAFLHPKRGTPPFILDLLANSGHDCYLYNSTRDLMRDFRATLFDMVLVDANADDQPVVDLIKIIRHSAECQAPVLVLFSRPDVSMIARVLAAGADDFASYQNCGDLLLRVESRLQSTNPNRRRLRDEICLGPYVLDPHRRNMRIDGQEQHLTPKEFCLASVLFCEPERLLPREHLEALIWGVPLPPLSRALAALVARLRRVLEIHPDSGLTIVCIHRTGYRLQVSPSLMQLPAPVASATPPWQAGKSADMRLCFPGAKSIQ